MNKLIHEEIMEQPQNEFNEYFKNNVEMNLFYKNYIS